MKLHGKMVAIPVSCESPLGLIMCSNICVFMYYTEVDTQDPSGHYYCSESHCVDNTFVSQSTPLYYSTAG